jgi:UPF0755 protein
MAFSRKQWIWTFVAIFFIGVTVVLIVGYAYYGKIMAPNVQADGEASLFVYHGDDLDAIVNRCAEDELLRDPDGFTWWAKRQGLDNLLKPGRYLVHDGMSSRELVNLLASGRQTPVRVTFNNLRTKYDLAGRIAQQLEPDSAEIMAYFDTSDVFHSAGLNADNFMTLFIPNTYELYWTSTPADFVARMIKEHDTFWNPARREAAQKIGLTPEQVYILASIVYSENEKAADEAPRIAGVYMNRIQKGMKLEADPTVKFAIGDFTIKRILFADLEIDSPYNTYKYTGLPPGPIHMPPIAYIDAVLHYEHHDYIFMCASGDGSGYHLFAKTLAEHNRNRDIYIRTLNKAGIKR